MPPLKALARAVFATPLRRVLTIVVLADLLVVGMAAVSLHSTHGGIRRQAAVAATNLNRLMASDIASDLELVDYGLAVVADEVRRQIETRNPNEKAILNFCARQLERLPMADSLRVTDARGRVLYPEGDAISGPVDLSDRAYFKALREGTVSGLAISEPLKGRISGKWVVVLARRIDDAQGRFAGMAFAPVTLDWFSDKLARLDVGPNGVAVMRGDASRNFDSLARFPRMDIVGQTKVSDAFRAMVAANPREGAYEAFAGTDNVHRAFAYSAVGHYPLVSLVGLASEDFMEPWWDELAKVASLVGAFVILSAVASAMLVRAWRKLHERSLELERSNADLEQFAYVASHDLQTPLRNIVSFSQLLERRYKGRLDDDADQFIGFIIQGTLHMAAMIGDLLSYARVSGQNMVPEPVALDPLLTQIRAQLSQAITDTGAELDIAPLPRVMGNEALLSSLLRNLADNALKYRAEGRKPLVRIANHTDFPGFAHITVSDNGIGIEPEYFDKIFVIFQRLQPGQSPNGTGIGLATCRRIVERLGGQIWVESTPGQGSVFHFTLPLAV